MAPFMTPFSTLVCIIYLLRKPVRTDMLLCDIDGKHQLKHAPAAKRSDINKTKNTKNVTRCRDS